MIKVKKITYPAFTGEEIRRLYVYLPTGYEYEKDRRYPVLYMFDGHNVFFDDDATYGKSWGLGQFLDRNDVPLIVVALECHHGENFERLYEYCPFSFEHKAFGKIEGYGRDTFDYFVNALKPMIDRRYRTFKEREYTYIAGSSMGGLMALYGVLEYRQYYSKAAALSPAIFLCYDQIKKLTAATQAGKDTTIYMDFGSEEIKGEGGNLKRFGEFGTLLMKKEIFLTQRIVPCGEHSEASWERQLPFVIETLMYEQ